MRRPRTVEGRRLCGTMGTEEGRGWDMRIAVAQMGSVAGEFDETARRMVERSRLAAARLRDALGVPRLRVAPPGACGAVGCDVA